MALQAVLVVRLQLLVLPVWHFGTDRTLVNPIPMAQVLAVALVLVSTPTVTRLVAIPLEVQLPEVALVELSVAALAAM
jgi:hypothetical protein